LLLTIEAGKFAKESKSLFDFLISEAKKECCYTGA
jgi:hypothetical protein